MLIAESLHTVDEIYEAVSDQPSAVSQNRAHALS
jgi:hypothetical protein